MSLKHFYTASSESKFPACTETIQTVQIRKLFFDVRIGMLIGAFTDRSKNWNIFDGSDSTYAYFSINKIWRDGTVIDGSTTDLAENAFMQGRLTMSEHKINNPNIIQTDRGIVVRSLDWGGQYDFISTQMDQPEAYYPIDPLWPQMTINDRVINASRILNSTGAYFYSRDVTVYLKRTPLAKVEIIQDPGGTMFTSPNSNSEWVNPMEVHPVDSNRVAVSFYPSPGPNNSDPFSPPPGPMILRIFNINTNPYTIDFEAELPGDDPWYDDVFCIDIKNGILYSMNRFKPLLHASFIARSPRYIAAPSIAESGVTVLREMTATQLSTIVVDSLGSVISNQVVRWTLSDVVSGGKLNSAYSLTNNSGIATITYVGPYQPPPGLTENVVVETGTI